MLLCVCFPTIGQCKKNVPLFTDAIVMCYYGKRFMHVHYYLEWLKYVDIALTCHIDSTSYIPEAIDCITLIISAFCQRQWNCYKILLAVVNVFFSMQA